MRSEFSEAVFPVVVELSLLSFEEAKDFACKVVGADDGTKTNRRRVRLRDHNPQPLTTRRIMRVPFGSTV